MTGMDSVLSALVDRVDAVADLVEPVGSDSEETWATLVRKAALGVVLAKHARVLTAELRERAELRQDVRR